MCAQHRKHPERPCLFSATVTTTSQLRQPFHKGNTLQIYCGYAWPTARVLARGQSSPATHAATLYMYVTSNSSICVTGNKAKFGLWIAGSLC